MIKALIFDLDNTVYPEDSGMEQNTVKLMREYAANFIGVSIETATQLRSDFLKKYGTTLEWLMAEHGFKDVDDYFNYVHPEGEEAFIKFDEKLPAFLDSIALPKFIFTNAPMEHATRVLNKLQITDKFEKVFDIKFCGLKGKPSRSAVDKVINAIGLAPSTLLFADDVPHYVQGFIDGGGNGVLVDFFNKHKDSPLPRIQSIYNIVDFGLPIKNKSL